MMYNRASVSVCVVVVWLMVSWSERQGPALDSVIRCSPAGLPARLSCSVKVGPGSVRSSDPKATALSRPAESEFVVAGSRGPYPCAHYRRCARLPDASQLWPVPSRCVHPHRNNRHNTPRKSTQRAPPTAAAAALDSGAWQQRLSAWQKCLVHACCGWSRCGWSLMLWLVTHAVLVTRAHTAHAECIHTAAIFDEAPAARAAAPAWQQPCLPAWRVLCSGPLTRSASRPLQS
jgi:hypothetical protein